MNFIPVMDKNELLSGYQKSSRISIPVRLIMQGIVVPEKIYIPRLSVQCH